MNRRRFFGIAGGSILAAAGGYYALSDKSNYMRSDVKNIYQTKINLRTDEKEILYLASLAPSGHNTQPWFIQYLEPYHWIICNDQCKWLHGVDPTQRETVLSIGAFSQNLEYAANHKGYDCHFTLLAENNQDKQMMEVTLFKSGKVHPFNVDKIKRRRTVKSNYLTETLKAEDVHYLMGQESNFFEYLPNNSREHHWLNEQTIEANRVQTHRNDAQHELAEWIRFSSKDAARYRNGLTLESMEIKGIPAWILRNFYGKNDVMKPGFRKQSIDQVVSQVSQSAGWILITSKDHSVESLLETGKRMQRLLLKIREKGIAIHPMTQILEESHANFQLLPSMGLSDPVQFVLRTGYLQHYPEPVSLRSPLDQMVRV